MKTRANRKRLTRAETAGRLLRRSDLGLWASSIPFPATNVTNPPKKCDDFPAGCYNAEVRGGREHPTEGGQQVFGATVSKLVRRLSPESLFKSFSDI